MEKFLVRLQPKGQSINGRVLTTAGALQPGGSAGRCSLVSARPEAAREQGCSSSQKGRRESSIKEKGRMENMELFSLQ